MVIKAPLDKVRPTLETTVPLRLIPPHIVQTLVQTEKAPAQESPSIASLVKQILRGS